MQAEQSETLQQSSPRPLRGKHEKAARLVVEDRLSDTEIAAQCGVSQRSLENWKKRPDFQDRVKQIQDAYAARTLGTGIAWRARRVASAVEDYERLETVLAERGADPTMRDVAGGKTGSLVRDFVTVRDKQGNQISVPTYEVDAALMRMRQDIRKEVGLELGQIPNEGMPGDAPTIQIMVSYESGVGKPAVIEARTIEVQYSGNGKGTPENLQIGDGSNP